mgnify:FL=1
MSEIEEIEQLEAVYEKNIRRIDSLIRIYDLVKSKGKGRKKVTETDTLRAAVVFIHSNLEDVMRGLAVVFWLKNKDINIINKVPLLHTGGRERADKFYLGYLCQFLGKTVDNVIQSSIEDYIYNQFTINNLGQLIGEIKNLNFSEELIGNMTADKKASIEDFFKRRHRIVHHADRNLESGQGQHGARAIKVETVNKWKQEIDEIISKLFTEAKTKISV